MFLLLRSSISSSFLGIFWGFLACILPIDHLYAGDRFERLHSESLGADQHGNGTSWEIESTVEEIKHPEPQALQKFDDGVFLTASDIQEIKKKPFFAYSYGFKNKGSNAIELHLSDESVIQSPLMDVAQAWAIKLGPQQVAHIRFLSDSLPKEQLSPVNVRIWDPSSRSWDIIGSGLASVFVPSEHALVSIDVAQIKTIGRFN